MKIEGISQKTEIEWNVVIYVFRFDDFGFVQTNCLLIFSDPELRSDEFSSLKRSNETHCNNSNCGEF